LEPDNFQVLRVGVESQAMSQFDQIVQRISLGIFKITGILNRPEYTVKIDFQVPQRYENLIAIIEPGIEFSMAGNLKPQYISLCRIAILTDDDYISFGGLFPPNMDSLKSDL
jgi:hypothetical protein